MRIWDESKCIFSLNLFQRLLIKLICVYINYLFSCKSIFFSHLACGRFFLYLFIFELKYCSFVSGFYFILMIFCVRLCVYRRSGGVIVRLRRSINFRSYVKIGKRCSRIDPVMIEGENRLAFGWNFSKLEFWGLQSETNVSTFIFIGN